MKLETTEDILELMNGHIFAAVLGTARTSYRRARSARYNGLLRDDLNCIRLYFCYRTNVFLIRKGQLKS